MKACGYDNLDEEWDILGYLENYRPEKIIKTGIISGPDLVQD